MIVSFFGHASFCKREEYEQKILALLEELVGDKTADFYLGGYGAFDAFALDCCRKYKSAHPNVTLVFVTPYLSVSYQQNNLRYRQINYDIIAYPDIENKPLKFAITYRNYWMVDKADYIIFYIDRRWGGAYQAYTYAKKNNKNIFNLFAAET